MIAKNILESKTFWLNALTLVAAILVELSTIELPGIDPKWVIMALTIVNIIIRLYTTQPVTVLPQGDAPPTVPPRN